MVNLCQQKVQRSTTQEQTYERLGRMPEYYNHQYLGTFTSLAYVHPPTGTKVIIMQSFCCRFWSDDAGSMTSKEFEK